MIKLERFNGSELYLNATMVEAVEATPDTVITMNNGKKIVVKNSADEVINLITEYYQTIGLLSLQVRQNAGCENVSK